MGENLVTSNTQRSRAEYGSSWCQEQIDKRKGKTC